MDANGHGHSHVCPLPSPQRDREVPQMLRGAREDKPMLFILSYPCEEVQAGKGENSKSQSL